MTLDLAAGKRAESSSILNPWLFAAYREDGVGAIAGREIKLTISSCAVVFWLGGDNFADPLGVLTGNSNIGDFKRIWEPFIGKLDWATFTDWTLGPAEIKCAVGNPDLLLRGDTWDGLTVDFNRIEFELTSNRVSDVSTFFANATNLKWLGVSIWSCVKEELLFFKCLNSARYLIFKTEPPGIVFIFWTGLSATDRVLKKDFPLHVQTDHPRYCSEPGIQNILE